MSAMPIPAPFTGGAVTTPIILPADPTLPLHATTKQYADAATAAVAASIPPPARLPFVRAASFGTLTNDGSVFAGFMTVANGTTGASPLTLYTASGATCSIDASQVLTVAGTVVGYWTPGMTIGGGKFGTIVGISSPITILSQLSGTTGGAGTYQLSANAPVMTAQGLYATSTPFTAGATAWSIQLPTGTSSALVTYTIASVVDPTSVTISALVTTQYSAAPVPAIPMGTDNSAALLAIHNAALSAGLPAIWFDPGLTLFAASTLAMGNVLFISDGSSTIIGGYQKQIIPWNAQQPAGVPRGCFAGNFPKLAATSTPTVVVLGDSITQTPPADAFDQTSYITAKLEQKMRREYAGRKTFNWLGYGIGGMSWRNLASTSPLGTVSTTMTTTNGSITITVASSTGVTTGLPISGTGISAGTLVANVVGTTVTMTNPATASGSGVSVTFGWASLPPWYTPTSNTWWSFVVAAAPDVIVLAFGMNSNNAGDDVTAIYTVLTNIAALSKVPDVIIITPYLPSNTNPATNNQAAQELRRTHAAITRGIAKRGVSGLNINVIDQNTWFMQARDGAGDQDTYLIQPALPRVGHTYTQVGNWAAYTPWVAPSWTTDYYMMLQMTTAQMALITASTPLLFGIGNGATNNLEVFRTAGNNFAVRVRLMDVAATSVTTSSTGSGAFTVVSGTGIVIGQKIVSTLFAAGTKVLSGSGTSWVASTNALSVGTDAAATFSIVPVDLFDTGVAIPTGAGPYYIRMTIKGNWLQIDYQNAISNSSVTTRLFGGYVEKLGGLFTPRLSLGAGQNIYVYEYGLGQQVPRMPILLDQQCFGNRYLTGTGETEPWGGNTVNHMAEPGQALVYEAMLANESFA